MSIVTKTSDNHTTDNNATSNNNDNKDSTNYSNNDDNNDNTLWAPQAWQPLHQVPQHGEVGLRLTYRSTRSCDVFLYCYDIT